MVSCAEKVNKNCSIVVSIPHSGEEIPMEVGANMKKGVLLPSVDWYLPQLYDFLPGLGAKVIINPIVPCSKTSLCLNTIVLLKSTPHARYIATQL